MNTSAKKLFALAMEQLDKAEIACGSWTLGGGTVISEICNHRTSKDIDIFLGNPQLLTALSPRVNDAVEDKLEDYQEMSNYIKLIFDEGKVDYIVAPQLSNAKPYEAQIEGRKIYIDDMAEIIAKKVFYRADNFKERDIFDLAMVYKHNGEKLVRTFAEIPGIAGKIEQLTEKLDKTPQQQYDRLICDNKIFALLEGSAAIRGQEIALCREFAQKVLTSA